MDAAERIALYMHRIEKDDITGLSKLNEYSSKVIYQPNVSEKGILYSISYLNAVRFVEHLISANKQEYIDL